jgi:hypothetical protein
MIDPHKEHLKRDISAHMSTPLPSLLEAR